VSRKVRTLLIKRDKKLAPARDEHETEKKYSHDAPVKNDTKTANREPGISPVIEILTLRYLFVSKY
jgi:hypothetical protein